MADEVQKEQAAEPGLEEKIKEGQALDKLTGPELKEIALKIEGLTGVHAMKKDELLTVIKKARGIPDEPSAKKAGGKVSSIADLKQTVKTLKEQKREAQQNKDAKRVNILRRRINRMKKRTKKTAKA